MKAENTHRCWTIQRPLFGIRHVGKVIRPVWKMQGERFVSVPPVIAYSCITLDDERLYSKSLESSG